MKISAFFAALVLLLASIPATGLPQHTHHHSPVKDSLKTSMDSIETARVSYTCPMHPEVKSDKPGKCPKCGMKLEKVIPKAPKDSLQTKHTSAPEPEEEMVLNVDVKQSRSGVRFHCGDLITGVEAIDDSVSECLPAGQVQTNGRSSCCVKQTQERNAEGLPKRK
jgi:hypothetical protein